MASSPSISFGLCVCFLLLFASSLNLVHGHGLQKKHVALFVFGDSLFDPGNNNYINTTYRANYWPYGQTFFKYPTGRVSDGRLIPDFIAEYAKLPLIPPYLQPDHNQECINGVNFASSSDGRLIPDFIAEYAKLPLIPPHLQPVRNHEFSYGVNFASSGAGALSETSQGFAIDLKTQLGFFKDVEKSLRKKLGDTEAKALISEAVYFINMGGNDYGFLLPSNNSTMFQAFSKEQFVEMVVGNLTNYIKEIYKKGGRKFGIMKLHNLGCLPIMKALIPGTTGACLEEATELAKLHNAALSEALEELETKLAGLKLAIHEFYSSMSERTNNPQKYGFKEVQIGCCGSGPYRGILSCGGQRGLPEYELCSDPTEYWFFDSSHLTDRAYGQLAELIWSGSPNITGPYNLKQLFEA